MKLKIAFATADGEKYVNSHFGDSKFYDIYEIDKENHSFYKRLTNPKIKEDGHADPKKAKGMVTFLKEEDVKVAVSKVYGPNLKRIKKKLVCIIAENETIVDSIKEIKDKFSLILEELEKGEERNFLRL